MLGKVKLQSRTVKLVHREAEGSLIALQLLLALATQTEAHAGKVVVLDSLESPRRILLRIGGGIAFAIITRPGPAPRTWVRPHSPPTAAAFTTGGVPLHDPAIEKILKHLLCSVGACR